MKLNNSGLLEPVFAVYCGLVNEMQANAFLTSEQFAFAYQLTTRQDVCRLIEFGAYFADIVQDSPVLERVLFGLYVADPHPQRVLIAPFLKYFEGLRYTSTLEASWSNYRTHTWFSIQTLTQCTEQLCKIPSGKALVLMQCERLAALAFSRGETKWLSLLLTQPFDDRKDLSLLEVVLKQVQSYRHFRLFATHYAHLFYYRMAWSKEQLLADIGEHAIACMKLTLECVRDECILYDYLYNTMHMNFEKYTLTSRRPLKQYADICNIYVTCSNIMHIMAGEFVYTFSLVC